MEAPRNARILVSFTIFSVKSHFKETFKFYYYFMKLRLSSTNQGNSDNTNIFPWLKVLKNTSMWLWQSPISQSNHTRTKALSNSMKLSHARGSTQDGRVMLERSDRIGSPRRKQFCLHLDPALCENKFLLFKPPDLWYFIRTILANEYRRQDYFMGTMIPFNKWFWHNWTVTY